MRRHIASCCLSLLVLFAAGLSRGATEENGTWQTTYEAFTNPATSVAHFYDFRMLTWKNYTSMGYPYQDYIAETDSLVAPFNVTKSPSGYINTVAATLSGMSIEPNTPTEISFDVRATSGDQRQGYGYSFTVWTWFDGGFNNPISPLFTFHTGMPANNVTAPSWQRGYPQFTTRIGSGYGICFAHLFESATYTKDQPCVYIPGLNTTNSTIDSGYARSSPKFRMTLAWDADYVVLVTVEQYAAANDTVPWRTIVNYTDEITWANFAATSPLFAAADLARFAIGTPITSVRLQNLRVRQLIADLVESPAPPPPLPPPMSTPMTTSVATTETTLTSVTGVANTKTARTDSLSSPTTTTVSRAAAVLHADDDNEPTDRLIFVLALSLGIVCTLLAVAAVCCSTKARLLWAHWMNSKVKLHLKNPPETEMSSVYHYSRTSLVDGGTIVAVPEPAANYSNLGLLNKSKVEPLTKKHPLYESAKDALRKRDDSTGSTGSIPQYDCMPTIDGEPNPSSKKD